MVRDILNDHPNRGYQHFRMSTTTFIGLRDVLLDRGLIRETQNMRANELAIFLFSHSSAPSIISGLSRTIRTQNSVSSSAPSPSRSPPSPSPPPPPPSSPPPENRSRVPPQALGRDHPRAGSASARKPPQSSATKSSAESLAAIAEQVLVLGRHQDWPCFRLLGFRI
uniref:DUF8040 domain-containing protein n=1 Tax=Ananas comosus var. bracteatus TaxID=296719 RepID=A0A6V7PHR0_ANACO|nr:unnamed protein product [Ananas comosus var. bracteatus]